MKHHPSTRWNPQKTLPYIMSCIRRPLSGLPQGPLPCLWGSPVTTLLSQHARNKKNPQQVCGCSLTPVQTSPGSSTPLHLCDTCATAWHVQTGTRTLPSLLAVNRADIHRVIPSQRTASATHGSSSTTRSTRMHSTCTAALMQRASDTLQEHVKPAVASLADSCCGTP